MLRERTQRFHHHTYQHKGIFFLGSLTIILVYDLFSLIIIPYRNWYKKWWYTRTHKKNIQSIRNGVSDDLAWRLRSVAVFVAEKVHGGQLSVIWCAHAWYARRAGQTRVHPVRARAQNPRIYEKFPGYRDATQFSGIVPEISGWLVGMNHLLGKWQFYEHLQSASLGNTHRDCASGCSPQMYYI